jgi:leucyl aminopeptidase (aminopeptidase T)
MAKKNHLFSCTGYVAKHLVSATIEDAEKKDVVLTFDQSIKPFVRAVAGEFTLAGKTVSSIAKDTSAKTITVVVTVDYANGNEISLVFNPTGKGATVTIPVTNNIA